MWSVCGIAGGTGRVEGVFVFHGCGMFGGFRGVRVGMVMCQCAV